jgi:endogenous inhibitor of DNA gyrase (YacG/DUF329 family)
MPGYCQYCGGEVVWQDNVGRREFCEECCEEVASGTDLQVKYDTDTGERL